MTDLKGSGVAAKYSAEGQPIVYEGTMYIPTGADDVFAVDVASGKILWEYQAHLEQTISTVCCGWLSRGVALGDGKVYLGRWTGSSSRSTRRPARSPGRRSSGAGRTGSRSPTRRSTTTTW